MFIRRQGAGELQARDYNRDENGQKNHRGGKWNQITDA
jgi:hypothetical protein